MTDRMPDERLAQLSIAALSPFPFDHPATQIVADAFAELVAEAKRARKKEVQWEATQDAYDRALCYASDLEAKLGDERVRADKAEAERDAMRDLLGSIWVYVDWLSVTRWLTRERNELWADAVDAAVGPGSVSPGETPRPIAVRWWRDDFGNTTAP